jgi:hypothetical protein
MLEAWQSPVSIIGISGFDIVQDFAPGIWDFPFSLTLSHQGRENHRELCH